MWLEIQRRRGLGLRPSAEELTAERRRFLAWWFLYRCPHGGAHEPGRGPRAGPLRARASGVDLQPNQVIIGADPEDELPPEAPQVGGTPRWVRQPERVFCQQCRGEMTFVAALAGSDEFDVSVVVNNDGGYQYHFGCPACRTITVLPQHT